MRHVLALALLIGALFAAPAGAHAAPSSGQTLWLRTPIGRLKARVFTSARLSAHPCLVVVLHGDAPTGPPSYQYRFAANAAGALADTVVAAILRPGYADPVGDRSAGERGIATGDNYTPQALRALTAAIDQLRARYSARRVTLVGHSGGAVLSADLAERGVASRAVLVSCPCDVAAWRHYMARKQLNPLWLLRVRSISPMMGAAALPATTHIVLLVGANDDIAPARFSRAFAAAAGRAQPRVQVLQGLGHEMLLAPPILKALVAFEGPLGGW